MNYTLPRLGARLLSALCLAALLASCADEPAAETRPTRTPKPAASGGAAPTAKPKSGESTPGGTWLVMLYEDADDEILEEDMLNDLNEAELVGSSDRVKIVAQMDRYDGGYDGDGDWTTAKRFLVQQDDDLTTLNSEELDDLGEVNMADGKTLVDFVTWAASSYPADHYALILSDHGAGWPGGWNDPDPEVASGVKVPLGESMGNMLFLNEIAQALDKITKSTSISSFDVVGFDACLMSQLEVYTAIAPYAHYAVASEEVEPSLGWAYAAFLRHLVDTPDADGASLAKAIVQSYITKDEQIVDAEARARYIKRMYDEDSSMTAKDVIQAETERTTLSAVDLAAIPGVVVALDDLVEAMATSEQKSVAASRRYALAFETVFDSDQPKPDIDLGSFANLLIEKSEDKAVSKAAEQLVAAIGSAVIDTSFGYKIKGATGISIHFPNSKLYQTGDAGPESYNTIAKAFAGQSLWDDFLAFHYDKTPLPARQAPTPTAAPNKPTATPDPAATAKPAPLSEEQASIGNDPITVGDVTASAETASAKKPVTIDTHIEGPNIAFVYVFVGRIDAESNAFQMLDMDYLEADNTKEVDGVSYPDWGESVDVSYDWDGTLMVLDDGKSTPIALLQPESYGSDTEDATYTLEGIYTTAKSNKERRALLRFSNGELVEALGYTSTDQSGAMREITPKKGDTFQIQEDLIPLTEGETEPIRKQGATLTFGKQKLGWDWVDAPAGDYQVGFIAEDFDGNWYTSFTSVAVK